MEGQCLSKVYKLDVEDMQKHSTPMRKNLQKKIQNINMICPCCGEEEESIEHCFLTCPEVQSIWFASRVKGGGRIQHVQFNQWLSNSFETEDEKFLQMINMKMVKEGEDTTRFGDHQPKKKL